ncbi:MAG: sigma 54-dependent Fis family transcriptional regulator [Myxococcales bacterium]|nr:sigma 54-dependent Fis family transcriptional regulator [Myxococcales bacterium]
MATTFALRVVSGPDLGGDAVAVTEPLAIGTAATNGLVLTDALVSRYHCELTATPAGLYLRDLGSTNGTLVDGVRIEAAYVRPGSRIAIGGTQLAVEAGADEIVEALPTADRFGRALGTSPAMRRVFSVMERVARTDSTILLEGETGTGKTLMAKMMHERSERAAGPFVVIDCSSIPPTLIESELFGHEKGSFTGAHAARAGAFEAAAGGTLFLDEIGELPLDMQPKLLRALEERVIKRVGSNEQVRLDLRLVAATNRDLRQEVNRSSFRADLYYRLNTVRVKVPALRERPEDIPLLIASFYQLYAGPGAAPSAALLTELMRRPWPGNVRELRSAVERAVLLGEVSDDDDPTVDDGGGPDLSVSFRDAKDEAVARFERRYVRDLLGAHKGNLSRAARAVRMDRNHLRDLAKRHDIPIRV